MYRAEGRICGVIGMGLNGIVSKYAAMESFLLTGALRCVASRRVLLHCITNGSVVRK
jgi:hypothetical protein